MDRWTGRETQSEAGAWMNGQNGKEEKSHEGEEKKILGGILKAEDPSGSGALFSSPALGSSLD